MIEARLLLKLARVEGWLDRYTNALRWITRGLNILDGLESTEADRQRAELLGWYGRFCQEGGKHRLAIKWCTQAVEQAELAEDKETMADALTDHRLGKHGPRSAGEPGELGEGAAPLRGDRGPARSGRRPQHAGRIRLLQGQLG